MARATRDPQADLQRGKGAWERHLRNMVRMGNAALDGGNPNLAADYLRRAQVAGRTLDRWLHIERAALTDGRAIPVPA